MPNTSTPGLAGARNTGILASTTPIVAFLDDDDEWLSEKLSRQIALLEQRGFQGPDAALLRILVVELRHPPQLGIPGAESIGLGATLGRHAFGIEDLRDGLVRPLQVAALLVDGPEKEGGLQVPG